MSVFKMTPPGKTLDKLTQMLERQSDLQMIVQHIRLSRMKLGSVLDRLERFEPGPEAIDQLRDHAENVAIEVQLFIKTLQLMMDE